MQNKTHRMRHNNIKQKRKELVLLIMQFVYAALCAVYSLIILFLLSKLIGNRQVSQLSMFDYINGITIGSIAAELSLVDNLEEAIVCSVAMAVYALAVFLINFWCNHSIPVRRFVEGTPKILFMNGQFYKKNFSRSRISLNEFFFQLRDKGYFDITQISMAVFEPNGTVSFLPNAVSRPVTPADMGLQPPPENILSAVVMDGVLIPENIAQYGLTQKELLLRLKQQGYSRLKEIFLATVDSNQELTVFPVSTKASSPFSGAPPQNPA